MDRGEFDLTSFSKMPQQTGATVEEIEDDDAEIEPETVLERLEGLTEMMPEVVRDISYNTIITSKNIVSWSYRWSREIGWGLISSATIMFLPLMFEKERFDMLQMTMDQERQLMLGPAAMGSALK